VRRLRAGAAAMLLALMTVGMVPNGAGAATENWPDVFEPAVLRTLNIQMTTQDWDFIRKDLTETYRPGYLSADGETPIYVAVRRKSSRALPSESNPIKVGLKIDINEYVDGQTWHGLNKLSLENGADSGVVEEGLAWAMHRLAGTPMNGFAVGYANWVRVNVNGQYIGLYVSAEQRDKQALRQRGLWSGGSTWLYENDLSSLVLEEGDPDSPAVQHFCYSPFRAQRKGSCPTPNDAALYTDLNAWIDMDAFLAHCAVEALTDNSDGMCTKGHNAFFVDFSAARMTNEGLRRLYMPWDVDTVFASPTGNIYGTKSGRKIVQSAYESVILNHPTFRAEYNTKLLALTDPTTGTLSESSLDELIDQLELLLGPALAADPYPTGSASTFDRLTSYLATRYASARAQAIANTNPPPRP
jgi:spore coat protein CotH